MSQYAIITDLNRCVGCRGCAVACKVVNNVEIGKYWLDLKRVGPTPKADGCGNWPDVEMYFLPYQCQHCTNPECVSVCPTGASMKLEDGTVVVDQEMCIGCEACITACPYGVRFLNPETLTVEKCNLCHDKVEEGELPQCVMQCSGRARFFGDLDEGLESFRGPGRCSILDDPSYEAVNKECFINFGGDSTKPYSDDEVHRFTDEGNDPNFIYILRNATWQMEE